MIWRNEDPHPEERIVFSWRVALLGIILIGGGGCSSQPAWSEPVDNIPPARLFDLESNRVVEQRLCVKVCRNQLQGPPHVCSRFTMSQGQFDQARKDGWMLNIKHPAVCERKGSRKWGEP